MNESRRTRTRMPTPELPNYPPRRSTGNTASHHRATIAFDDPLNPEDFTDVFGGPPRTILSRQFCAGGNHPRSSSSSSTVFSYEYIFRQPEKAAPEAKSGRKLPHFRIPFGKQMSFNGNYSDIFGWDIDDESVVRSRSKTSSSSALSSEELSPLRPVISEDVSLFGSKLRPINVRTRWNSNKIGDNQDYQRPFGDQSSIRNISEIDFFEYMKNYPFGPNRRNASPENISIEPMSTGSFRKSTDELKFNSPSSSVCQLSVDRETKTCEIVDEELHEDEIMDSYVIEFDIGNREWACEESNGVDEAIAWAKEKFQTHCNEEKPTEETMVTGLQLSEGHADIFQSVDENMDEWAAEEETTSKVQVEMQILDEKIRLWSTGKEADIRLLLSSLHHIVWPNSGWVAIPLMNIIESSQVRKAYQKAQLCLHPDKLQQRGASFTHKYIARKVFSALQDAWAAFISRDA